MIISRTPFRISFFGGGTDFPAFFRQHGGTVLAATIDQYCYLSVHRLAPLFKHRFRASYSRTESVLRPEEFQHPLIRETLRLLDQREGIEIAHTADLPGQTGLGSSSAFTVGLLNAVQAFNGHLRTPAAGRTSTKRPTAASGGSTSRRTTPCACATSPSPPPVSTRWNRA